MNEKIVDLSHVIYPGMPVYPGTESPVFEAIGTVEKDGFLEKRITLFSHTGTHIDAPAHIIPKAITLDKMEIAKFYGSAFVLDVSTIRSATITKDYLQRLQHLFINTEFLLFHSGWSKYWGDSKYFADYPTLEPQAAKWLASLDLKGIGIDMISFDPVDVKVMKNHNILLQKGLLLIENLTNLELLTEKNFQFACFPLNLSDSDGAPARAVAFLTSST